MTDRIQPDSTDRVRAALEKARDDAALFAIQQAKHGRRLMDWAPPQLEAALAVIEVIEAAKHADSCGCGYGSCFYCVLRVRLNAWADVILGDKPNQTTS